MRELPEPRPGPAPHAGPSREGPDPDVGGRPPLVRPPSTASLGKLAWPLGIVLACVVALAGCEPLGLRHIEAGDMAVVTLPYKQIAGVDPNLLSLDIYTDPSFTGRPVVFYVHGGGLRTGDKSNRASYLEKADHFVSNGYVYVSINYRLSPGVVSPSHVEDVADAFMYVHDTVARYGGDADRIFVMGHSAGAYLVSLLATNERYLEGAGGSLPLIRGVVSLDTWTYLSVQDWQEEEVSNDPWERHQAVPANHVRAGKGIPPFLLFYRDGRRAAAVQTDQLAFVALLHGSEIAAAAILAEGDSHVRVNQEVGTSDDQKTEIIMAFLLDPHSVNEIARRYGFTAR